MRGRPSPCAGVRLEPRMEAPPSRPTFAARDTRGGWGCDAHAVSPLGARSSGASDDDCASKNASANDVSRETSTAVAHEKASCREGGDYARSEANEGTVSPLPRPVCVAT
jgi:hypothetical protein